MVIPQSTNNKRGNKRFYWDIVINNYSSEECEIVKAIFEEFCDAYIIAKEIGTVNGTPHLQMMIKLKKGNYKSFLLSKFKNSIVGERASIREGRNITAMKEYCLKDGDIYASKNVDKIKIKKKLQREEIRQMMVDESEKNYYEFMIKFIEDRDNGWV